MRPTGGGFLTITRFREWKVVIERHLSQLDHRVAAAGGSSRLTGSITMWPTGSAPNGWLLCNGATYPVVDYPALAGVLGSSGGNFTVPDLRDRFPIGVSGTKAPVAAGGAATKTIVAANLPPHVHTIPNHAHDILRGAGVGTIGTVARGSSTAAPDGTTVAGGAGNTGNGPGTSTALDVMPPWRALNFIIRT